MDIIRNENGIMYNLTRCINRDDYNTNTDTSTNKLLLEEFSNYSSNLNIIDTRDVIKKLYRDLYMESDT